MNNAGIGSKGINYDKTDYQAFENVMKKLMLEDLFVGMKNSCANEVIVIKNKKGSIINVSSLAAVKVLNSMLIVFLKEQLFH